jgi:hypothetical protein
MIQILDDPFELYPEIQKEREKQRKLQEKIAKKGRVGKRGGYRPGAGRKRQRPYDYIVGINVNTIQESLLKEMGNGDIRLGIQKLIESM